MKTSVGARTLIVPTPVWVVCSYDAEGKPNAMTVAWGGICCSKPPCVGIALRKATYTYGNITERNAFTVNVPSERYAKEADYFGTVTGREVDKFAATGLTPEKSDLVDAPFVKEFPLVLECRVIQATEIGLHTHFVGEIIDVKVDNSALGENGLPDIKKVRPLIYSPEVRAYYGVGKPIGKAFSMGKDF
jgi:flavin reductase (DIM6/NTAB) family NADH-FMN oxidoreductase RutF